jgi:thiol:disulfide interchange protein DsbG
MFNKNGRVVTFDQMRRLQGEKDPIFDDLLNAPTTATAPTTTASTAPATPATPAAAPSTLSKSEQLWNDVQQAASFPLGAATAPPMYVFIDPACPHCKELVQKMIPAVDAGQIRLMVLLVGALAPESAGWAAGLLANANPGQALRTMVETNTAPTSADANDIRLKNNHNLMKKWRFDGTPVSVYRAQDGRIKLLTGAPKSADIILNDLR